MADKKLSNKKNRDSAIKMLDEVISILNEFKIDYYLDFGTLLGAVREKGFILWDDDIDISLFNEKDYQKIPKILKEIEKRYKYKIRLYTFEDAVDRCKDKCDKDIYFTKKSNFQIAKIKKKSLLSKDLMVLDIFFKYEYKSQLYWYVGGLINKVDTEVFLNGLETIEFYDLKCKIPKNFSSYLTEVYGTWQEPNKKWDNSHCLTIKG